MALLGVILLFQIHPVQTHITQYVLHWLSNRTDHPISIDRIEIAWFDKVNLHGFLILDQASDTLLYAEKLSVNYRVKDLLSQEFLRIQEVYSENMILHLIKRDSSSQLNLSQFINSLGRKEAANKEKKPINVEEINFTDFIFSLSDHTKDALENRLDFSHLDMAFSDFSLSDWSLVNDTIRMKVVQLRGEEKKVDFEMVDFHSDLLLSSQTLSLTHLYFDTKTSHISDSVNLYFSGLEDLSYFVDSVSFGVYLSDSKLSKKDLDLIVGDVGLKSGISFDGLVRGTVGDFNMEQAKIGFGNESFIEGGASCFGFPNLKGTFVLADITDSHLITEDIRPYVGELSENVAQLGKLDFTGSFAGFLNDFVARGGFVTEKGSIHSDINLKIPEDPNRIKYSGNLKLIDVDIGAFLGTNEIKEVSLKGSIIGEGTTLEEAHFNLDALFVDVGLNDYVYDTIYVNGEFANQFFKGSFSISDPNCVIYGYTDMDLRHDVEQLKVNIQIDSARLDQLNLTNQPLFTSGALALDITNLKLDKFTGKAKISNGFADFGNRTISVDSLNFSAGLKDSVRSFNLQMPGLESEVTGPFSISDAVKDLSIMISDYKSKITLEKDPLIERERSGNSYKIQLFVKVGDVSSYLESLNIPLTIPEGAFLECGFRESKNANISLYGESDLIQYNEIKLVNSYLEVNGSEDINGEGILTNFIFESERQEVAELPETDYFLVEGVWFDDSIDFTTSIRQEKTKSNVSIQMNALLFKDSIKVKFEPSRLLLFGDDWVFNDENHIILYSDYITLNDFELHDETESIAINGVYSDEKATNIKLAINGLDLSKANPFLDISLFGLLDGKFSFSRSTGRDSFQFEGGFLASKFTLDNFLVGDVTGNAKWDAEEKSVFSKFEVDRENFYSLNLRGHYHPLRVDDPLDFQLDFDLADLRLAQPFLEDNVSNLKGRAVGHLKIKGLASAPIVTGNCNISEAGLTLNYLNTDYTFGGDVKFLPGAVVFNRFDLEDRKGSITNVEGQITHEAFSNILLDINLIANNFEFFNTTSTDNSLYYGSANGTGTIDISGPVNDLLVKASVKTESDTRLFIPVSEGGDVSRQGYISFIDPNDSSSGDIGEKYSLRGLTLDFDIEIIPDAYCELIFDIKTGDIIRGRGNGNLKLTLDTDGEFHMFGPLEITEGAYNFTVPGFINKEFVVTPGSHITWLGNPYDAILDIDATYQQRASFEDLNRPEKGSDSEVPTKVPINVLLSLEGNMAAPEIDFGLALVQETDVQDNKQALLAQITSDEQELRRQVISLLFFNRFSPQSSFVIREGNNIGNSVSEFLSSQASYLMSQLDENLEIEVDFANLDDGAFNAFQLRLTYTFLNGRLTVTRGGGFSNQQEESNQVLKDIAGDWSVEYSLTDDGRLRAKVFSNATNQRTVAVQNASTQETGVSLRFAHSFSDFKELLSRSRQNAMRRRKEENEEEVSKWTLPTQTPY